MIIRCFSVSLLTTKNQGNLPVIQNISRSSHKKIIQDKIEAINYNCLYLNKVIEVQLSHRGMVIGIWVITTLILSNQDNPKVE
jgi:hypothetical protein